MSLLTEPKAKYLGRSLNDLSAMADTSGDHNSDEDGETLSGKLGPLRRAFSSIKRRRKTHVNTNNLSKDTNTLRVRPVSPHLTPYGYNISSPASDLAARRGVFNRRHYGSVEFLTSNGEGEGHSAGRFRVESGDRDPEDCIVPSPLHSPIHLENPESETRWYYKYFLGRLHQNYVGSDSEKEPFLLSVVVTDSNNHSTQQYRAILWKKTGAQRHCIKYNPHKPLTVKVLLSHFNIHKTEKGPKEIYDHDIQKDLLVLEEQEGSVNFKFGVIYAKEGQTSDDEMFSNECGSPAFNRFVDLLGDRVRLKGWHNFKAGLDIKNDTTGTESVYTLYEGHEIMFHVSSLLPYSEDNKQQVERKRHIGNDIMNIVYVEGCPSDRQPSFRPSMMKTHFTHIFLVVSHDEEMDSYRLGVFSEEAVPLFGPCLPSPPIFTNHQQFRDFLLVKLINGEKAAFNVPVFAQKRTRTLDMLIKGHYDDHIQEKSQITMLNRRAFSDVIADNHSRLKVENRHTDFIRFGESLKPKTQTTTPTSASIFNTNFIKREPWEPQLWHGNFPHQVICADSWGTRMIVATESAGTMILEDCFSPCVIFDKTMPVKQLSVVEELGLFICRTDKAKDSGKIFVFKLLDFEGLPNEYSRSKLDCKNHRIEKSKGCHLYALSRLDAGNLRLVICVGKRLLVYSWKHSAAWSAWCPTVDIVEAVDGFTFMRELPTFEVPCLLTLIDGGVSNHICVGYKNTFELINEKNGDTLQLFQVDSNKVSLVSAVALYDDVEPELLLSYNHMSHFQRLKEESKTDSDFQWTSEPKAIVCAFPYVMAFTHDTIEIRLVINGNLVHTMALPDLVLLTAKYDIYFASSAQSSPEATSNGQPHSPFISNCSPMSVKTTPIQPYINLFKIPLVNLVGHFSYERASMLPPPSPGIAPIIVTNDHTTGPNQTCPHRTVARRVASLNLNQSKNRHDSSSSDSGIHSMRASPPVSPGFTLYSSQETDIM